MTRRIPSKRRRSTGSLERALREARQATVDAHEALIDLYRELNAARAEARRARYASDPYWEPRW